MNLNDSVPWDGKMAALLQPTVVVNLGGLAFAGIEVPHGGWLQVGMWDQDRIAWIFPGGKWGVLDVGRELSVCESASSGP